MVKRRTTQEPQSLIHVRNYHEHHTVTHDHVTTETNAITTSTHASTTTIHRHAPPTTTTTSSSSSSHPPTSLPPSPSVTVTAANAIHTTPRNSIPRLSITNAFQKTKPFRSKINVSKKKKKKKCRFFGWRRRKRTTLFLAVVMTTIMVAIVLLLLMLMPVMVVPLTPRDVASSRSSRGKRTSTTNTGDNGRNKYSNNGVLLGSNTTIELPRGATATRESGVVTTIAQQQQQQSQPVSFVTVVLPSVVNPKGRKKRLNAIASTWGPMSRAIYITHPGTDSDFSFSDWNGKDPAGSTVFPQIMPIDPTIATENQQGIARLKHVITQVSQRFNPDFAFFVNDHTFVIPQHLCSFLQKHHFQPDQHLYAGHALRPKNQRGDIPFAFNSGASGYFLSRKTMQSLTGKWEEGTDPACGDQNDEKRRKWLQGNPGLVIAECIKKGLGVDPIDTRDELKRHVFHAFGIIRVVKKEMDEWYERKHEDLYEILGEDTLYQHQLQKGKSCCSPETASFHYVEWAETLALWDILMQVQQWKNASTGANGIKSKRIMTKDELKQLILDKWPKDKKDIGGYSHNLPPLTRTDVWDDLLSVVMAIAPNPDEGCSCNDG